jgi:hypothetical protein
MEARTRRVRRRKRDVRSRGPVPGELRSSMAYSLLERGIG